MTKNESDNQINDKAESRHNLTGFFKLLYEIDARNNPHNYENKRDTNNTNKGE